MAIVTGGLYRIFQKYPDLNLDECTIIGWGAGQFFRDYYPSIKSYLTLSHTICPLSENHGKILHGVEVVSPQNFLERKTPCLVVIFSNQVSMIMNQIRDQFGDIPVVSAADINSDAALSLEVDGFHSNFEYIRYTKKIPENPLFGIVVQGLICDYTPQVLAWNKFRYPDSYQCMVTWDHQPKGLIEKCLPWLDELELVKQPDVLGPFLFNTSIRSCKIGLQKISDKNIKYAVRTRSDSLLIGSIYSVLEKYFTRSRNNSKIAVSLGFAWKDVPFHFSDRLMVGHTEALLNAWSMSEFDSSTDYNNFQGKYENNDLKSVSEIAPESLFWRDVAARLSYPNEKLLDSYEFARDFLLPLDPLLTHKSMKLLSLFNIQFNNNLCFDENSWSQLYTNFDDYVAHSKFIENSDFKLRDLLAKKIG